MELTLSRDCAIQTDLLTPDGQCLYTIFTPNKLTIKTTTITKHVLDEDGHTSQESIELARINWNPFGSSRLVYDGKIVDFSRLMPGEGMLNRYVVASQLKVRKVHKNNRVRCLAGPDGKAYKWRMGWLTSYVCTQPAKSRALTTDPRLPYTSSSSSKVQGSLSSSQECSSRASSRAGSQHS
ncbi:uncharacterized protein PHACADRAFT_257187 [Phanerochaete carnosa HHB-10118-sp]|uniref:DUF6593 domain-containing protein n=1 Tax=Phanerochaete carnosa (strain HHB-10118-sp) TaxID=650164 RepID=K5VX14_PHACS|nr:uncharacterized protein PHACADRAFT_257187 [Phanerochaete carnosa HHB-10118-sp]EKM56113.1 hypothetical protein PHACADRAFT_257187 [Phanerochaete carnosa HHB-10118-sp]